MALTRSQAAIWQKARTLGGSGQAVALTDGICNYLIATIAYDLSITDEFPEFPTAPRDFFTSGSLASLVIDGHDARKLFERLVTANRDADTFFACLAALHKARLKYERILSTQPIATLEQVGPRGLLQYGTLRGEALAGLLFWRKWFFDIDNRAGQETGYLFEPIIAYAIGGTPAPARRSPVKRHADPTRGRQVDCLIDNQAYELKIRVTSAASGQGRWQEELDFPVDCRRSGFVPILVCMDGTKNSKLDALVRAFEAEKGEVYIGEAAWNHLDEAAGPTMTCFLERYVRAPLTDLLSNAKAQLPRLAATSGEFCIEIQVGDECLRINRQVADSALPEVDPMPVDADETIPGS